MATKTTVVLIDDVSGYEGDDVKTVEFGIDGITYEVDLSDINEETLRNSLSAFVEHARKVKAGKRGGKRGSGSKAKGEQAARIRQAAKAAGVEVKNKGRIPNDVMAKFSNA